MQRQEPVWSLGEAAKHVSLWTQLPWLLWECQLPATNLMGAFSCSSAFATSESLPPQCCRQPGQRQAAAAACTPRGTDGADTLHAQSGHSQVTQ